MIDNKQKLTKNNKYISILFKSELLKNTTILVSGTAFAQLIPILLQPVLRRCYTPDLFGAYSVYISLLGIIIVFSSFRYELAIINPRDDSQASNILILSFLINFIVNLLLFLIILSVKNKILDFLNLDEKYIAFIYFLPLGGFLFGSYQGINYWLIRKKKFLQVSYIKFIRRGFEGSSQVGFFFTGVNSGLLLGDLVGHLANTISGYYQAVKSGFSLKLIRLNKIHDAFIEYQDYPKFNLIPGLMSSCSFLLPAIMINKFYSTAYTGYFDLSKLLLSIPLALIATSISNVLMQRISEKNKNGISISKDIFFIFFLVLAGGIVEIIVIELWAEDLFGLFFGTEWVFSGIISKILVLSYAMNFIVSSFSGIFIALRKIKILSIWQIIYFLAIVSLVLFRRNDFLDFIRVYVTIEVFCSLLLAGIISYVFLDYEKKIRISVS